MPDESIEEHPHGERVLEIVILLEARASDGEFPGRARAIPDIPLVECDMDRTRIWISHARGLDLALHHRDAVLDIARHRQELLEVVIAISNVSVQRDVIDLRLQAVEHRPIPA